MEWSDWWFRLAPLMMLPFALLGVVSLTSGFWRENLWVVPRQRYQQLADNFLVCQEREGYVFSLLREADRNYLDQRLHWWAWNELLRFHEVPLEPRAFEHDEKPADPDPGAVVPLVGPHDPSRAYRVGDGPPVDFPL